MEKENLLQDHLEGLLGEGIYHVMMINKMGRVEAEAVKRDISLPYEKREVFSMGLRLHLSLLQEFDQEFGAVEHFVVRRKKVKIVSVPFGQRALVFVMDSNSSHDEVVRKAGIAGSLESSIPGAEPLHVEAVVHG